MIAARCETRAVKQAATSPSGYAAELVRCCGKFVQKLICSEIFGDFRLVAGRLVGFEQQGAAMSLQANVGSHHFVGRPHNPGASLIMKSRNVSITRRFHVSPCLRCLVTNPCHVPCGNELEEFFATGTTSLYKLQQATCLFLMSSASA
jgi:hypothetical protein